MVRDQRSARPAQRKGSIKPNRSSTKKQLSTAAPRALVVERPAKPLPPKVVGELPVPTSTFFL
jgi:hypothetical protein